MGKILKNRRIWLITAGLAVLLAIALWPRATEVDLAEVTKGRLRVTVDEEGETRVRDRYVVSAPAAGELGRIELEPGNPVDGGRTVVARLRPSAPTPLDARTRAESSATAEAAEAALERARAERERAAAVADRAQQRHERLQRLWESRSVTRDALEAQEADARTARAALDAAERAVDQTRHELEAARARLVQGTPDPQTGELTLVAPVDGVVLQRHHESQTVVMAGEPLLDVGNPGRLEVVSDLLSSEAVRVTPGDAVLIEHWGGDETLRGRVRHVEPAGFLKVSALGVEEQRVNVVVDLEDPENAYARLGDAYRVEVRIVTWERDAVIKAPVGALFRRSEDWAVFVDDGGRARLRTLEIARRNSEEAQVTKGLRAGERVVLYPPDTLEDGTRITPRDDA